MIVVDRIEGQRAVVEFDGEIIEIPLSCLPDGVGEGAALCFVAVEATDARREAEERLARLRASSPPGDEFDL